MCLFLAAVKSEYQGRISEGIHQAFVAAESLRMYLVWFTNITFYYFRVFCFIRLSYLEQEPRVGPGAVSMWVSK